MRLEELPELPRREFIRLGPDRLVLDGVCLEVDCGNAVPPTKAICDWHERALTPETRKAYRQAVRLFLASEKRPGGPSKMAAKVALNALARAAQELS